MRATVSPAGHKADGRVGHRTGLHSVTASVTTAAMVSPPPLKESRAKHEPPLSQRQLAKMIGVTRETVARWETRKRRVDHERLPQIAEATGIAPAALRPDLAASLEN